jgi:act minimal PKS ketosynthase (KS/KS alpha)
MTGLKADGRELAEAIRESLRLTGAAPEEIDYVNAHGSGTRQNDRHETAAFKRSLGDHAHRVPVSSIKSMVGHSLGAIGAIEVAASALAIEHGVVPPTANLTIPDPECDLDYVPHEAREQQLDLVLSVGSGFGGFQTAVVLSSPRRKR